MARYQEEIIPNVTAFVELITQSVGYNGNKRSYSFGERQRFQLPGKDVFRPKGGISFDVKNSDLDVEFPAYALNGDLVDGKTYSWRDLEKVIYSAYRYVANLRDTGTLPE